MYSLAHSRVKNKTSIWESMKGMNDEEGLKTLNISQCTALTPPAVQAVCDSFPALHTCSGRHSLIMSGCLNLMSVHCACAFHAHRTASTFPHPAHWTVGLQQQSIETLFEEPNEAKYHFVCMFVLIFWRLWWQVCSHLLLKPSDNEKFTWALCLRFFLYVNSAVVLAFRDYVDKKSVGYGYHVDNISLY